MNPMTFLVGFGIGVSVWLVLCWWLYHRFRTAPWLAGATVTTCLFSLGIAVVASLRVPGTLVLVPLWCGVSGLCALHLRAAWHETTVAEIPAQARPQGEQKIVSPSTGAADPLI